MKEELKKNKDRMRMHYRGMNGRLVLLTDTKISIGQHFVNFVNISMRRKSKTKLLKWRGYNVQLVYAINRYIPIYFSDKNNYIFVHKPKRAI